MLEREKLVFTRVSQDYDQEIQDVNNSNSFARKRPGMKVALFRVYVSQSSTLVL